MSDMKEQEMTRDDLIQYLKIYNSDIDWGPQLDLLKKRVAGPGGSFTPEKIRLVRNQVACAILLPTYDPSSLSNPPEKLLFTCSKFSQFESREWYEDLLKVFKKDQAIKETRQQALSFGIVYPLEYNPRSRQAYLWLIDRAKAADGFTLEVGQKFENLVYTYGGAVICNIFNKPEWQKKLDHLVNWRSGYFFERLIYDVYKPDEILKIKMNDLNEIKRSNPKLVKKIRQESA